MMDAIQELKVRAEILHKRIAANDPAAVARLRALPVSRRTAEVRRRDCLAVIAAELGFPNWPQAKHTLTTEEDITDFGDLLCPPRFGGGHINRWFARYEEAAAVRETCLGYLLAYRRQFLVVDRYYIEDLGLDPEDADWDALGFDWARPANPAARVRLYAKLIAALPRDTGSKP
jgi:hypothetical protein